MPKKSGTEILAPLVVDMSLEALQATFQELGQGVMRQMEADTVEAQVEAKQQSIALVGQELTQGDREELVTKRDQLVELLFAIEARAKRIRKTVQNAEKMARQYENFGKSLESSIESFMLESNIERIEGNLHRFSIFKSPDQLRILDEAQIPAEYFDDVPASKELNKDRLKEALEAGTEVAGAFLEVNRRRLDVK